MKLAVIGNTGGTGKTTISVHIAGAIAERKKVCLIDADYAQLSAMHWLFGRNKEYEFGKIYCKENLYGICFKREDLEAGIKEIEKKFNYVVIDGRPEPGVTITILGAMKEKEPVIIPIRVGEEAIKQAYELREIINEINNKIKVYVVINKRTQSRISQMLINEIERLGFEPLADFSFSELMKWAEKEGKFFWEIKGSGRLPHGFYFRGIAKFFMEGML